MLFLLLFGTATLLLCGFLYWQTKDYLADRVTETLVMEQARFGGLTASELRELLTAHVAMDPQIERPFTLFGPAGQPIAGSLLGPPDLEVLGLPQDQPFTFTRPQGHRDRPLSRSDPPSPGRPLPACCPGHDGRPRFQEICCCSLVYGAALRPSCSA